MPVVKQVGGTHYSAAEGKCPQCNGVIQHWDVAANLPGLEYAATKYIWRHAAKNGFEDLKKAISYVEKRMALDYPAEYAEWQAPGKRVQDGVSVSECTDWPVYSSDHGVRSLCCIQCSYPREKHYGPLAQCPIRRFDNR